MFNPFTYIIGTASAEEAPATGAADATQSVGQSPDAFGAGLDAAAPAPDAADAAVDAAVNGGADAAAQVANAATATVDNPYGLGALWAQGDFVSKTTLIILLVMSVATWFILFTRLWDQQKLMNQYKQTGKNFWGSASLQEGANKLPKGNAYRSITEAGLAAVKQHDGFLTDQIEIHEWISMSVRRAVEFFTGRLTNGLAVLATVGSTAPFVGLFGTVWGIYHALIAIGIAGQASIDKVAGPVGEALIMTAFGLAVAVPAVLGYNWLVRRNKMAIEQLRNFAGDVEAFLLSGVKKSGH